jgi:hypothetical protein
MTDATPVQNPAHHAKCLARVARFGRTPGACSDDGALARSTSTVHAVHVQILQEGTRANWILGGYYHDVFARSPDGWRIRERIAIGTYEEGRFHPDARIFRGLADYTRPL